MSAMPAWANFERISFLSARSSWSHLAYCLSSYHLDFHVLMTPSRKPYG
jgi:hypothetical protein